MRHRKVKLTAVALLSATICHGAYSALVCNGPAELWTNGEIAKLTASSVKTILAFGAKFGSQMYVKHQQILHALSVATKQEALSAKMITDNTRVVAEKFVDAIKAQKEFERKTDAIKRFSHETGQGFEPGETNARNKTLEAAFESVPAVAKSSMNKIDVSPGRLVSSRVDAVKKRIDLHREKFCTESEQAAGICTVGELPGGDTNASLLFEPVMQGSLKSEARAAYIQNVLGAPDELVPKSAGNTPLGQRYLFMKNRKDALLSIPAYSLSMIDAANTQTEELKQKSPNEALTLRVNQYFGGNEAENWSKILAKQEIRGLLVEAAKISGLEIWLRHKQYEQNQRIEANLAALVLIAAEKQAGTLRSQHESIIKQSVNKSIE